MVEFDIVGVSKNTGIMSEFDAINVQWEKSENVKKMKLLLHKQSVHWNHTRTHLAVIRSPFCALQIRKRKLQV